MISIWGYEEGLSFCMRLVGRSVLVLWPKGCDVSLSCSLCHSLRTFFTNRFFLVLFQSLAALFHPLVYSHNVEKIQYWLIIFNFHVRFIYLKNIYTFAAPFQRIIINKKTVRVIRRLGWWTSILQMIRLSCFVCTLFPRFFFFYYYTAWHNELPKFFFLSSGLILFLGNVFFFVGVL